jgi:hypothetical protein
MLRRVRRISVRSQRGQSAAESMGVLLLVAVIIGALIASGLPDRIAGATGDMIDKISGGQETAGQTGGGNGPGGGGNGGPGGGGNGPGGDGDDGGADATALATCLSSGKAYGYCLKAFDPARYFVETRPGAALDRVDDATKAILNSGARPGTPEFDRLVAARNRAVDEYLATKPTANNRILRALNTTKKLFDPRFKDVDAINKEIARLRGTPATVAPPRPNTASGGPRTATSADRFLKGLSKVGKGLGIVGTGLGLYTNVKNDGVAKGVTKTAGGVAGAYGFSAAAAAGCAALAVTGVGAVACGLGVLAVGVVGSEVGSRAAGWVYDNALAPAGEAIGNVAEDAAGVVSDGAEKVKEGAGKVVSALNPFG